MRSLSVLAGVLLMAGSLAGLYVDVGNNWTYGLTVSPEWTVALVAAAIGVAGFPAVAGLRDWSVRCKLLFAFGTAVSVVFTVSAAYLAYGNKQSALADTRRGAEATYQSAKADEAAARTEEAAARAEAAAIGETATVDALQALADEAKEKADREAGRGGCLGKCEAAKDAYAALLARLGQAKAKASALKRAEEARKRVQQAQDRTKAGPKSAPPSALWIAARTGWQVEDVGDNIDIALTTLAIIFTQILAWCTHPAVKCLVWGFERPATQPASTVDPVAPSAKAAPRARRRSKRTTPAANVAEVRAWAAQALISRPGAAVAATDAFLAFQAETGSGLSQVAFGTAMGAAGFSRAKRGRKAYTDVAFKQALRLAVVG